jgi:tetratricopeptide (TPR) repeat protein
MPPKKSLRPSDRPQTHETWAVLVAQLRVWITVENQAPWRPFVVLVLDLNHDALLNQDVSQTAPTALAVEAILAKAMNQPARGAGKPRRPAVVRCADPVLAEALAPGLARVSVAGEVGPLPELAEALRELEDAIRGGPEHPGLLSVRGVTPALVGGLFAAAADYFRAAPWVQLTNGQTFALQIPAISPATQIVSVMGNGGVEYGLAVYKSWAAFEKVYLGADDPRELLSGQVALWYGGPEMLPFDDLELCQRNGWDVAGPEAYPMAIVVKGESGLLRPDLGQLRWLEAALRAIPGLVRDQLRPDGHGEYRPFETTVSVATAAGEMAMRATYPGGQLPLARRPVHAQDWVTLAPDDDETDDVPVVDQRMLEAILAHEVEGGDLADPKLRQAQDLMYQAWEETNPAKRLVLAHRALATSPDCADAYVLLAEEEADSLARAADYYRQGVEAGERALGPAYFAENRGHFWGLVETRPYMRAREGLAQTLWSLQRRDEAVTHYQALLALNPEDNQGVRYSLLNLLLEADREAEAAALLKQFKDGMAEWRYTGALLAFRKAAAAPATERRLAAALKGNPYVPGYLTGRKRIPAQLPPYYGAGDESEAIHYAHRYLNYWRKTPGAVDWLASHTDKQK